MFSIENLEYMKIDQCLIRLSDNEEHYEAEMHCDNLERKTGDLQLSPQENILKGDESQNRRKTKKISYFCYDCNKTFISESTYRDHLNSKKHKNNIKCVEVDLEYIFQKKDARECIDENTMSENQCLFCSYKSRNLYKNLEHMTSYHSFFIPDIEYCTDIKGLLVYLGEKVMKDFMCLWCNENGRTFYSADAAKRHMVDKGHCRIQFEGIARTEYANFYDHSSLYSAFNEASNVLDDTGYQWVLPSGIKVGHRSLLRYYKQKPSSSASVPTNDLQNVLCTCLVFANCTGLAEPQKDQIGVRRDICLSKKMESRCHTKVAVRSNNFQKHLRPQDKYYVFSST